MSIVLSVCGVNFSLMMSDGRMVKINDMTSNDLTIVDENCKKIRRINRNVMIGFTGDPIPMINTLNELSTYTNLESLTLERIKRIVINSLKKQQINFLGVKLIISGRNKSNIFVTYTIDSKNDFKEIPYIIDFPNGFAVNYALPNDDNGKLENICKKHIDNTMPWVNLDNLKRHMKDCINEISKECPSINNNIFEEFIE